MADRFYKNVEIAPTDSGYHVLLDGRILKTPGKKPLICPNEHQAQCVAGEWQAQQEKIKPETMPCTRLLNVACELTVDRRPELVDEFRKYCETDLLCYRAAHPADLAARQNEVWQPVLDWAASIHGIELATTTGLEAIDQPEKSLKQAERIAAKLTDVNLTLLLHYTASFGSAVLALSVLENHIGAHEAYEQSTLDEQFQNERWGTDEEAVARNALLRTELIALAQLI